MTIHPHRNDEPSPPSSRRTNAGLVPLIVTLAIALAGFTIWGVWKSRSSGPENTPAFERSVPDRKTGPRQTLFVKQNAQVSQFVETACVTWNT